MPCLAVVSIGLFRLSYEFDEVRVDAAAR
jgi:hypothetical protein